MTEIDDWTNDVHHGDSMEVLDELPAESIHAVVTDPPYGLNFMGRDWDNFRRRNNDADVERDDVGGRLSATAPASGAETDMHAYQEWCEEWASRAKRVLKPGGHLLAFSGNRTHHRLFCGVEDAGFEVRDTLTWHYGSGFPKALDVSKSLDKQADEDREVVETVDPRGRFDNSDRSSDAINTRWRGYEDRDDDRVVSQKKVTKPATDAAKRWDGWKTCLKPATEFVVLARKPLSEGTVAENVLEHGTGALNIDGCRIGDWEHTNTVDDKRGGLVGGEYNDPADEEVVEGRYPANVAFDERAAAALDAGVGETVSEGGRVTNPFDGSSDAVFGDGEGKKQEGENPGYGDSGGPSRYFYTSKASRSERTLDGAIDNDHPTVKPTDLMEWLVRMVTREGQIVLDPFTGSGTTCLAAKNLGRKFVGIELQENYVSIAQARAGIEVDDPSVLGDENQSSLGEYAEPQAGASGDSASASGDGDSQ